MFPDIQEYMEAKNTNYPHIEVSQKEFVRLFMQYRDTTKNKALSQAKICKALGSSVLIGNQLVSIK